MNYLLQNGTDEEQESGNNEVIEAPNERPGLNALYLDQLIEMGFSRNEAEEALMMSRNDYELACEILLNSERRQERNSSLNYPS